MKKDRLLITKDMIPYTFNILLADELFNLTIQHNKRHDFFTVTLKKGGNLICEGEPIVYGVPLFKDVYMAGNYPALDIIPIDESGEQNSVTFENFNDTVFLMVDNVGGEENEQ